MGEMAEAGVTGGSEVPMLNAWNTVVYRLLTDIEEVDFHRGDLVVVHGAHRGKLGYTLMEIMRWLDRGWVEEVPLPAPRPRRAEST